ncbi:hypothetical protein LF845_00755 [Deferribacterales bacterium Es71-Z0220]|nr:hypothetical protein [Deferrivibrio essentukiensis]
MIEMLIVIAIPQYAKIRIRVANTTTLSDVKNTKTNLNVFYSEKNYYLF